MHRLTRLDWPRAWRRRAHCECGASAWIAPPEPLASQETVWDLAKLWMDYHRQYPELLPAQLAQKIAEESA